MLKLRKQGKSFKEIAILAGVSRQRIQQITSRYTSPPNRKIRILTLNKKIVSRKLDIKYLVARIKILSQQIIKDKAELKNIKL